MEFLEKRQNLVVSVMRFALGWHLAYMGVWALTSEWTHSWAGVFRCAHWLFGGLFRAIGGSAAMGAVDLAIACVGGGSNAMGLFAGFIDDPEVKLVGVEAGGKGIASGEHAASINGGRLGVLHGAKTMLLQTDDGNILDTYSVSAGLDYPGVGPEHCHLHDTGRAEYTVVDDDEAIAAFDALCRFEGIIPALESSHALAEAIRRAPGMDKDKMLLVNLSGRGDKDMENIMRYKKAHASASNV